MKKNRNRVGCLEKWQRDLVCVREGQRGYFEEKVGEEMEDGGQVEGKGLKL